jgi:hypothetical protein
MSFLKYLNNLIEKIQQFVFGNKCPVDAAEAVINKIMSRKPSDMHIFTIEQLDDIRYIWSARDSFDIKTFIDLKNHVNDKYSINKSRSVYCRVINKREAYAEK